MAPVRVLHIVTYMGLGGLETMLMNYYRRIDRTQLQFDFLVHRDFEAAYDAEIRSLGGRIYRLPRLNPFSPSYHKALDRFFATHPEYQIVHSHLDCMAGIPLKTAAKHRVPVRIAHAHNASQTKDYKYPIKLFFRRNISNYATDLIACSHSAGQWMFNGVPYRILANAIDTKLFQYHHNSTFRQDRQIPDSHLLIGHVGRFAPQKNHDFLLKIFSALIKIHPHATLLLIGEGPLMDRTIQQVKKFNLSDHVIFTGSRTDIPELLSAMDVFVLPSFHEGLPVSLIEAQAAGLPCLISDTISDECCITPLVQRLSLEDSPKTWAKAILSAAKSPRQDTSAEITAAGFDIEANANILQSFYLSHGKK